MKETYQIWQFDRFMKWEDYSILERHWKGRDEKRMLRSVNVSLIGFQIL